MEDYSGKYRELQIPKTPNHIQMMLISNAAPGGRGVLKAKGLWLIVAILK